MTEAPLFATTSISKNFGGLAALKNVSVTQHRDELVGMIGPNGSGKSTFVNVVCGVLRQNSGTISLQGKDIGSLHQHDVARAGIARTFQAVRVFERLSLRDNVLNGLLGSKVSPAEALDRARAALERVGLQADPSEPAERLGLYDRRKLELATRLVSDPKLLMLDEPVGGLNPEEIRAMMALIETLRRDCGIFIIEHTMKVITSLADRVVVLVNGEKLTDDRPDAVLKDQAVIATYLGTRDA